MWALWIIAACVAAGAGFVLRRPGLVAFALAALPAGLVSLAIGDMAAWAVFLILCAVLFIGLARLRRTSRPARQAVLDAEQLIGLTGVVVERIANAEAVGSIRVGRQVWTARAYNDGFVIDVGARVEVIEARGATALVE